MKISFIVIGALAFLFGYYIFTSYKKMKNMPLPAEHAKVKILSVQNFENQIKNGVVLVDFWAPWCAPCKMMAPVINEVADELTGNAAVGKLDVDQNQAVAAKYNVRSIPTLILFKNGKEVTRFVGVKTKDFLVKQINQNK